MWRHFKGGKIGFFTHLTHVKGVGPSANDNHTLLKQRKERICRGCFVAPLRAMRVEAWKLFPSYVWSSKKLLEWQIDNRHPLEWHMYNFS